jgi:uncharacterized membrane protein
MKAKAFLAGLDEARLLAAIKEAEGRSSAEVRVFVAHGPCGDAVAAARRQFSRLGMHRTRESNGVLVFVSPRSRRFAILGDAGIHAKVGQSAWDRIAAEMAERFRAGDLTGAVEGAVRAAGELLETHFPRRPDDVNELPDAIAGG